MLRYRLSMLICVGGLPGSGRKDFALALAEKLGFYSFGLESVMRSSHLIREYRMRRPEGIISDDLRLRMYRHAARSFDGIAHTFKNVVVHEPFHRRVPREFLFEAGEQSFGDVRLLWIEDTKADLNERARRLCEKNPRLTQADAAKIIRAMEADFEPFVDAPHIMRDVYGDPAAADRAAEILDL